MLCPYRISEHSFSETEARIALEASWGLCLMAGFSNPRMDRKGDNRFYTYALLDEDGAAVYVGKGSGDRWRAHEKEAQDRSNRSQKHRWIRNQWEHGHRVLRCKVAQGLYEHEAFALEKELIELIGLEKLLNVTEGGADPFKGLTPAYLKMIAKARAKMQAKRSRPMVPTNHIQNMAAGYPVQTPDALKRLLVARGLPWCTPGPGGGKDALLRLIRIGADEMFAVLGLAPAGTITQERLFLQRVAVQHPEWSVVECIAYAKDQGRLRNPAKTDTVPTSDMRGVMKAYAVMVQKARQQKATNPNTRVGWSEAPDANLDQEGASAQNAMAFVPPGNFGHNGGPVWNDAD